MATRVSGGFFQRSTTQISLQLGATANIVLGISGFVAVVAFVVGLAINEPSVTYFSMSIFAFMMPLATGLLINRKFDLFEPINIIAVAIFFATTMRAPFLIGSTSDRADFLMMGTSFDVVNSYVPWMLMGVFTMCAGYVLLDARVALERYEFFRNYAIDAKKLWIAIYGSTILGVIGIAAYIRRYGLTLDNGLLALSLKRNNQFMTESGELIYGKGYEAFVGQISQYAFYLLCAILLARLIKSNPRNMLILSAIFIISCMIPFLVSSRSSIIILLIVAVTTAYYYQRVRIWQIVFATITVVALLVSLGIIREINQLGEVSRSSVVEQVIGSGNGIDFVRSAAIMDRVPAVRDFLGGSSYLALFTSVVPRALWPEKPNPALGPWVKSDLFGQKVQNNGWPSGMIAEGYLNFGFAGIAIAMFLYGALLRIFYESCKPLLGLSLPITLIYAAANWRLTFGAIGLNFAHGILQTLQAVGPTILLLIFIRVRIRAH